MSKVKAYFRTFFFTFFKWICFPPKIFAGRSWPRAFVDRADGAYADFTTAEIISAMAYAGRKMLEDGLTLESYVWRQNDCDDYAFAKVFYARAYLRDHYGARIGTKGIPIGMFGYWRDDGKQHQIVKALIHAHPIYFEAYAEPQYAAVKELSKAEIGSVTFDVM